MNFAEFVELLEGVKPNGDGVKALCPAHDDKNPSLTVDEGDDGRIILKCWAGCNTEDVVKALGLSLRDLFRDSSSGRSSSSRSSASSSRSSRSGSSSKSKKKRPTKKKTKTKAKKKPRKKAKGKSGDPIAVYDYTDRDGKLLYQVCRFEPKDFIQRRPNPEYDPTSPKTSRRYLWNMRGVERCMYRLPERSAVPPNDPARPVFFVEGEKDADNLARIGAVATTTPGGAKAFQNVEDLSPLHGRHVVILPDNDAPGREYAYTVAEGIHEHAASVKIVCLSGLDEHGDVSDWIAKQEKAGRSHSEIRINLQDQAYNTSVYDPEKPPDMLIGLLTSYDLLTTDFPEPVFIVPEILPAGLVTLAGRPKVGKSWAALQISHAVSIGWGLWGKEVEQGRVLYLALEDSPRRLAQRMNLIGWTKNKAGACDFMTLRPFRSTFGDLSDGGADRLRDAILSRGYRLVVIDTFSRGFTGDQNDGEAMTAALSPIQMAAIEIDAAVLLVDHHKKAQGYGASNRDAIDDLVGSTAKAAIMDGVIGLYRKRGDAEATLHVTGRDLSDAELLLTNDPDRGGAWNLVGDAEKSRVNKAQQEILEALEKAPPEGYSSSDLGATVDHTRQYCHRLLLHLQADGLVLKNKTKWILSVDGVSWRSNPPEEYDDDDEDFEDWWHK